MRLFLLALLMVAPFAAIAQEAPSYAATAIMSGDAESDALQKAVLADLERALGARGLLTTDRPDVLLLVDAAPDGERVAVSVSVLYPLPEEVIALGADAEAFYTRLASTNRPEEGAHIRREVSRQWLEQFYTVTDQHLKLGAASDTTELVDALLEAVLTGN